MKRFISIIVSSLAGVLLFNQQAVLAADPNVDKYFGVNDLIEKGVSLGNKDLVSSVAGLINIFLGFLGVIAVIFIIYGGFVWITSRGAPEKIQRAKMIIISAVVGIAIILSAYAIASYVINRLREAVGPVVVVPPPPPPPGPLPTCPEPAVPTDMRVCQVSPTSGGVDTVVTIYGWHFASYDAANSFVTFDNGVNAADAEVVACGPSIVWQETATPNYYVVRIRVPNLPAAANYSIEVGNRAIPTSDVWPDAGLGFSITAAAPGPGIYCLNPDNGPIGQTVDILGVRFGTGNPGDTISMDADAGPGLSVTNFGDPGVSWSDQQITFNIRNDAISSDVVVQVSGVDSNPDYFRVTCNNNSDCASGCCQSNACRAVAACTVTPPGASGPRINSVDPDNGAVGNYVTIYGSNFGATPGTVRFTDSGGVDHLGVPPSHPQCVTNYWFADHISIAVPAGLAIETVQVSITTAAPASADSNAVSFDVNSTVRPGLCRVEPMSGIFTDSVNLYGNNFAAGDDILFGGITGDNNNIINNTDATTEVPNLLGGVVGMQIENSVSGEVSNSLPFTVLGVAGGDPRINSIDPNPAPPGQYVTIQGANFGNFPGQVHFGITPGDFSFPPQCSDSFWRDDRIIVKVPVVPDGNYGVVVTRNSDGATNSTPFDFSVDSSRVRTPGICRMDPDNGPPGTNVDFFGDNFGNAAGVVRFYDNQPAAGVAIWNNQQVIDAVVPLSAATGPVVVEDSGGNQSNALYFSVGACPDDQFCVDNGLGTQCCSGNAGNYCAATCDPAPSQCVYPWTLGTQAEPFGLRYAYCGETSYQTPVPWPHNANDSNGIPQASLDSYVDTNILINFTRNVRDADLLDPANFQVLQCNTGGIFDDTACGGAPLTGIYTIVNNESDEEGLMFNPFGSTGTHLNPDTWYRIDFGTFNAAVGGDVWPSPSNPAPDYHFRTRADTDACVPSAVSVSPQSPAADVFIGQSRTFTALPTASNCNICGGNYNWTWAKIADPSPQSVNNTINPTVNNLSPTGSTVFTGGSRSDPAPVVLEATMTDFGLSATAETVVRAPNLGVRAFGPDCVPACTTAVVYVEFNEVLDSGPGNVNTTNFRLVDSANNPVGISTWMPLPNQVEIVHGPLVNGETYTVTVSGNVRSAAGDTLGADFIWSFIVGVGSECVISAAEVTPASYSSVISSEAVPYMVTPMANTSSCGLVPVTCDPASACTYSWFSDNDPVGDVVLETVQNTRVLSGLNGTANITGTVTHNGVPFSDTSVFDVNVFTPNAFDFSILPGWQPTGGAVCMNSAIVVDFSAAVDEASVESAMRVYEHSFTGAIGCLVDNFSPVGGFFCPSSGNFVFQDIELDGIDPELESRAIFNAANVLNAAELYLVLIDNSVQSREPGGVFVPGAMPQIDVDGGGNDGYGWMFNTGDLVCQISFVNIFPSPDTFTCAYDNCLGDVDSALAGNQHRYTAVPLDVSGQLLNVSMIPDINWGVVGPLLTLGANGNQIMDATAANQSGQEVLTVTMSGPTVGSGSASANVSLFLCENPWPNPSGPVWTPWREASYNFSTYYCQAATASDPVLPTLPTPFSFVRNNPSPEVIREYIFFVDPNVTLNSGDVLYPLGTLARAAKEQTVHRWWSRLISWLEPPTVQGAAGNPAPTNFRHRVTGPNSIELSWYGTGGLGYVVQKKLVSEAVWNTIGSLMPDEFTFPDNTLNVGDSYNYRVGQAYGGNIISYTDPITILNFGVEVSSQDIIGIRIMRNDGHLSVLDWYRRTAPNADVGGALTEIDGYEALVVGSTTYIAAANVSGSNLYTNIYIFARNVGAQVDTEEIYSQLIANLRFNTNLTIDNTNICRDEGSISCASDFDCVSDRGAYVGPCLSRGLKLRRDMQRLGGIMEVNNLVQDYGVSHRACSNNANIQCVQSGDCVGGGTCVSYYPLLNAGTFVAGMSASRWPSWDDTLSQTLNLELPDDPINRFNGCPSDFDPETCWDAIDREFQCGQNSMVYLYRSLANGTDYEVVTNFEYDMVVPGTFASNLRPDGGVNNINHLSANLNSICSVAVVNPPGPGSAACGNGIVDAGEECDGHYQTQACRAALAPTYGIRNWWNEQSIGCYPRGYRDAGGNLLECTWYDPNPPLSPAICGGYCGDSTLQPFYELCEGACTDTDGNGVYLCSGTYYSCPSGSTVVCRASICQPVCDDGAPATSDIAASACGDGEWDENAEDCDASGVPDGLAGWSCSMGGNLRCNSQCIKTCDVGIPSNAVCGNDLWETVEECDYTDWTIPSPQFATSTNAYTCSPICNFVGQPYCGNGIRESAFGEQCDTTYTPPTPSASRIDRQYECGVPPNANACQTRAGGYCGDASVQAAYGEICDTNYASPSPATSSATLQYACSSSCRPNAGGYCGDGAVQELVNGLPKEECDPNSSNFLGWGCSDGQPILCNTDCTRYCNAPGVPLDAVCGDGAVSGSEDCDWNGYTAPDPRSSSSNNAYSCSNTCRFTGQPYCGDGAVQTPFGEVCDPVGYVAPTPANSGPNNRYQCGAAPNTNACQPTEGGYCGDGNPQAPFGEDCDPAGFVPPIPSASSPANRYQCSADCEDDLPSQPYCGDGTAQPVYAEECDGADGMLNWTCSDGVGTISCTGGCVRSCTSGIPVNAVCGDGTVQVGEDCDPPGNTGVTPAASSANNQYSCDAGCQFSGGYCGDGSRQAPFGESCDPSGYTAPAPNVSNINNQYSCTGSCVFSGGYCGDNTRQALFGELCDGTSYIAPAPSASSAANQYQCAGTCLTTTGGYCRDGILQAAFGEACDDGNSINTDNCSNNCTYTCVADGVGYPSGNVNTVPITFNGGPNVTLVDSDSATINLPSCRVSGNVLADVYVDPGTINGTTAAIVVIDNSAADRSCVSDGGYPSPGADWNITNGPEPVLDCTTNNVAWTHYGHLGDKTVMQAKRDSLLGILNAMELADPNMGVSMVHYGHGNPLVGVFPTNYTILDDNLNHAQPLFMPIAGAKISMPAWNAQYNGEVLNSNTGPGSFDTAYAAAMLTYVDYLFNRPEAAAYDNRLLVIVNHNHNSGPSDYNRVNSWSSHLPGYTNIEDLWAQGIKVVTINFTNGRPQGTYWYPTNASYMFSVSDSTACVFPSACLFPLETCGDGITHDFTGEGIRSGPVFWPPNPGVLDQPLYIEECDGQPGCGANCRWIDRSRARAFNVRDDSSLAAGWVINPPPGAFIVPAEFTSLEINSGSGWQNIVLPGTLPATISNVPIDTRSLNAGSCDFGDPPNNLPFSVRFNASAALDASVRFSSGDYNYCPW